MGSGAGGISPPSNASGFFVSLFYRRLLLWAFSMLLVLTVVLYLCTVFGTGRYDIISVLMIFSSMLLLNAVWFFDVSINATTEIWLKERVRRIMLGLAALLSCVTSALMLSSFLRIRFPRAEEGVSTIHLLFAAMLSMAILLHRYGSGSWRDVIIQSPWGMESESSRRNKHKKNDGDSSSSNGSALGQFKFVKRVMQKEVFLSLKWSALIVAAAILGIFVARNAYADTLSETLCEQLHLSGNNGNGHDPASSSSSSLDTMVTGLVGNTTATLCKEFREESGVHSVYTLSLLFQTCIIVALIQLLPLTMFASLKMVVFSPVSFIAPPAYEGGAVESTSSLRKSQSNASDAAVAGERADKLTGAMAFGYECIRRKVPSLSWQVDHNRDNGGGGGGSGGSMSSSSSSSSFGRACAAATSSAAIHPPRWQEALYVYRAIQAELVASVKAPYLGPPVVPYLQNGGHGFGMLGGSGSGSGSGGTIGVGTGGGRLLTIMRALAMEDFALVLSSRTWGLVQCRKQLFARGCWCDAIVAALTFVSAITLQVQIVTCHAMEEVLEHQQQYREERQAARDQQQRSKGSSSSGSNSSSKGEDAFKFNQIMGGHFQVKNLDRVSGIPQAVVHLIRASRDRVDGSVLGYLGNKMLRAWASFAWARPLLRALYARYPFSHALPPFILQTCINAVRGVSKGLEHALTDDPTGMAEYHLIGAMELLIKLELALEEYEVCMRRCHVNVFTDSNIKRARTRGGGGGGEGLSPSSAAAAAVYDVKSLQIEVSTAIDTLVGSYRDVLSRPDCPLLQDDSTAPVLLARIKSIH